MHSPTPYYALAVHQDQRIEDRMKKRSADIIFGTFASFGYLVLVAYFGLMAFEHSFGTDPNIGLASFAIMIGVICVWRFFCSTRRVFRRTATKDDTFNKAPDDTADVGH